MACRRGSRTTGMPHPSQDERRTSCKDEGSYPSIPRRRRRPLLERIHQPRTRRGMRMKLPRLTGKEVARAVERFGFRHTHTTGSHFVYKHPDGRKTTIPQHAGEEIGPGLLLKI